MIIFMVLFSLQVFETNFGVRLQWPAEILKFSQLRLNSIKTVHLSNLISTITAGSYLKTVEKRVLQA